MKPHKKAKIFSVINTNGEMFRVGQKVYDCYNKLFTIEYFDTRVDIVREEPGMWITYIVAKHKGKDIKDNVDFITSKKR